MKSIQEWLVRSTYKATANIYSHHEKHNKVKTLDKMLESGLVNNLKEDSYEIDIENKDNKN